MFNLIFHLEPILGYNLGSSFLSGDPVFLTLFFDVLCLSYIKFLQIQESVSGLSIMFHCLNGLFLTHNMYVKYEGIVGT